jgi:hypothetical protein
LRAIPPAQLFRFIIFPPPRFCTSQGDWFQDDEESALQADEIEALEAELEEGVMVDDAWGRKTRPEIFEEIEQAELDVERVAAGRLEVDGSVAARAGISDTTGATIGVGRKKKKRVTVADRLLFGDDDDDEDGNEDDDDDDEDGEGNDESDFSGVDDVDDEAGDASSGDEDEDAGADAKSVWLSAARIASVIESAALMSPHSLP